jgi:hypothetical protein
MTSGSGFGLAWPQTCSQLKPNESWSEALNLAYAVPRFKIGILRLLENYILAGAFTSWDILWPIWRPIS